MSLVSWILFSNQIRWKQSLHTGCWRQKDARFLSGDSTWRLRRRWMDDGHENRRNKGISYNSNDHEIKTVVFIKGLREKREHSILSSTQDSLLHLLVHTIQFNKTFRARWLADLEVISKCHSLPSSQRNEIARRQFSFRPSFFFLFFKNCFTIWISYAEIKFDGCGEKKSFLLKDTFQGLKVKTGKGLKEKSG